MKSNLNMFMIMFGFTFFSGSMLIGQQLSDGLPFGKFFFVIIAGGVTLGFFGGLLSFIGCKTHKTMSELSQVAFGTKGSFFPSVLIGITQIGWYGVGISMFAMPVAQQLFPESHLAVYTLVAIFGTLMTISTCLGIRSITRLSYLAVPIIILFGIAIIVLAINQKNINIIAEFGSGKEISLVYGVQIVIGSYISGSITTPNFTKDAENPRTTAIISFCAFLVGNGLMFIFGAFSHVLVGGSDIFDLFTQFNCLILGIIVLGLNIWSSCDNGLYSAGLEFQNVTGIKHQKIIIVAGLFSMVFSIQIYNNFCDFLTILNKTLPPVGVVLIISYFGTKQTDDTDNEYNWWSIMAVVVGAVAGLVLEIGIPSLNGIIVTSIICIIGSIKKWSAI